MTIPAEPPQPPRLLRSARRRRALLGFVACAIALGGLGAYSAYPPCGAYPDWRASPYSLPYPAGATFTLYQGNCTLGGHHAVYRYSYDFLMPIGTLVTAARSGVVFATLEGFPDDASTGDNWVKVRHADGTFAAYSHLHSALVAVGDAVRVGDPLGLSGNSGRTGGTPHLHFQVSPCPEPVNCDTLPVTFNNAGPNPRGLLGGRSYTAYALPSP